MKEQSTATRPVAIEIIGQRNNVKRESAVVIVVERKIAKCAGNRTNDLVAFMIVQDKIGRKQGRILQVERNIVVIPGVDRSEIFVIGESTTPSIAGRKGIGKVHLYITDQRIKVGADSFCVNRQLRPVMNDKMVLMYTGDAKA